MTTRWNELPRDDWVALNAQLRRVVSALDAAGGGGGATDLGYVAATRVITSSTGADTAIPVVTSPNAGLAPASGGGTTNFLRADGTWATPPGGGGGGSTYFPSGW